MEKSKVIKYGVRCVLGILELLFFVPSFFVSCQGQKISISGVNLAFGKSYDGYKMFGAHPFALILMLIPIAAAVLLYVIKDQKKLGLYLTIAGGADILVWIIARIRVASLASESMCESGIKAGFIFNILVALLLSGIGVMMMSDNVFKASMEAVTNGMSAVRKSTEDAHANVITEWTCNKCGAQVPAGNSYCTECGGKIPAELLAEMERVAAEAAAKRAAEEAAKAAEAAANAPAGQTASEAPAFCSGCGAKLSADQVFCPQCGKKVR